MPAVPDPEYAYRQLRRSPLDYIEIQRPEETKEAVLRFKNDSDLYQAMIQNGIERAGEFSAERIVKRWAQVLFDLLPRQANRPSAKILRHVPLGLLYSIRKRLHWLSGKQRW